MNILLIDDDEIEHKLVDTFLMLRYGKEYNLTATTSLDEAVDELASDTFDCILLDNQLRPFGEARDTVPRVRAAAPETPLLIISVCSLENGASEEVGGLIDGYVNKFDLKNAITGGLLNEQTTARAAA